MIKESENENLIQTDIDFNLTKSVWKQVDEGDWKMFYTTENTKEIETKTLCKLGHVVKFRKRKEDDELKLGIRVMTPIGIGVLTQSEDDIYTVRFRKTETKTFNPIQIKAEFDVIIRFMSNNSDNCWYRLTLSSNGNVAYLKKQIDRLELVNSDLCIYRIIHMGVELKDEETTFEELNFKNNEKLLIFGMSRKEYKLTRFTKLSRDWECKTDSIAFFVNRKITLTALGLYCISTGGQESARISFYLTEGDLKAAVRNRTRQRRSQQIDNNLPYSETLISTQSIRIPSGTDFIPIVKINLDKTVNIKPNVVYRIEIEYINEILQFYGSGCKPLCFGEGNVEFTFKLAFHSSKAIKGNFSEFYYHI